VRNDHRVVVDVGDAGARQRGLGHLVRAGAGREAGADVDELADTLSRHVRDRAGEEGAVAPGEFR
jgi:hypothetical protein